ncbi:capsular polysaccharide export protein, LipB/KpsS family [Paracoccus benzoatiresistens]|uniref:Capsular biosynthesis protein n=1 Tax=Paracoccus benzoatiresistens TaxID=2997341 RepID=A0ABT4J2I0_9RHOB|nr:hypothetical protein [Paracoccus sp. EF6]MCZ0961303.1 hypothetical protein [Paracoccus sp. EF6]
MDQPRILRIYLHPPMLQTARAGKLGFLNRMTRLLADRGWQVAIHWSGEAARKAAPDLPGYALFHMERPTHDRALTFRRAYHYPFWRLERHGERWNWPVALARFDPATVDADATRDFAGRLRGRVLPGPDPVRGDHVLIPLQGRLRDCRSFQTMSPVDMVEAVARTGRRAIATLHPKETYDAEDRRALDALARRYPNLTIGGDTARLLRDCALVATQNSAVGFDGLILEKPVVLFGMSDFHHIALNVADLGAKAALARAEGHRPDFAAYLDWFLRRTSLDMMAPDADDRLLAAMEKGGWPV